MKKLATDMNLYYARFMDLMKTAGQVDHGYAKALIEFIKQAEKPGALSTKTKELISIALSVTANCVFCIALHTKNAIAEGATKQEICEAGLVPGLMGGGPAVAHLHYLIDACDQFGAK